MMRTLLLAIFLFLSTLATAQPRVAYWIEGNQHGEKVVLIHGFSSSHATWAALVPVLAKQYQVLTYDQPGHGLSSAAGEDYSPKHMAEELKVLMDDLKLEKAHIVGHSMGGRTAVKFASLYPEKVSSLVVEDMNFIADAGMKAQLPALRAKYAKVRDGLPSTFKSVDEAMAALKEFYTRDEILWVLAAANLRPDGTVLLGNRPEVTSLYLAEGLALDMTEELKAIRSRLAFFAADPKLDTAVLKSEGLEHVRKTRPDAFVKVFAGSGHLIHGRPDFAEALLLFLVAR